MEQLSKGQRLSLAQNAPDSIFQIGLAAQGLALDFLEKIDGLTGRLVDNANFFSVSSPDEHSDAELYDLLMTEYPAWLKLAKEKGLLA